MIGLVHPGVTLREDFMEPRGLSAAGLAEGLGVSRNRVGDIRRGRRGITVDTALRLEHAFGVSAAFRLDLQSHHELEPASRGAGPAIDETVKRFPSPTAA